MEEKNFKIIPITHNDKIIDVKCSEIDYEELIKHKWYILENYVIGNINGKTITMHRYIKSKLEKIEIPKHDLVDHKKSDTFDNRRSMLRIATFSQNSNNKRKRSNVASKYYGVQRNRDGFQVIATLNGIHTYVGRYKDEKEAAIAYDIYMLSLPNFESLFFNLNFPDQKEEHKQMKPFKKKLKLNEYYGVIKNGNKYSAQISINRKIVFKHISIDPIECGKFRDEYIVKNNLNKILTFKETYPDYKYQKPIKHIGIKIPNTNFVKISINKYFTVIDDFNYEKIKYHSITYKKGYMVIEIDCKFYKLHRYLANEFDHDIIVKHIDGNNLNNTIINLSKKNRNKQ